MELGPAVNIHRSPLNGRDSEYISEDPYLAANLAVPYIEGMQSTGTLACIKHFACNNEEVDRGYVNVIVDERTLREIYLPAFEAAVKRAHVAAIMAAYNRVNGSYCAENWYLLNEVLRKDWGYKGLAVSDWGAVHSTVPAVNGGLDLEMPGPGHLAASDLAKALGQKAITQVEIDHAVKDILRTMIRAGLADPGKYVPENSVVGSPANQQVATQAAIEGMVLLKNDQNLLPLNPRVPQRIVMIGPRVKQWQIDAYGSPGVQPTTSIDAYEGVAQRIARIAGSTLSYLPGISGKETAAIPSDDLSSDNDALHGFHGVYFNNMNLGGAPSAFREDTNIDFIFTDQTRPVSIPAEQFSARWTSTLTAPETGNYEFTVTSDDGNRLWIGDDLITNDWNDHGPVTTTGYISLVAGQKYPLKLEYYQDGGDASLSLGWLTPSMSAEQGREESNTIKNADVVLVCVGSEREAEGSDRSSIDLPGDQDQLIQSVAAENPHTIVVLNNGGPVLMNSWIDSVPSVLEAGFPGENGGKALAAILFGDANPSGKLVDTVAMRREDYPDYANFPGVAGKVTYAEGIYVGYRAFDKHGLTPLFPFGYGLSYTQYKYSNLNVAQKSWNSTGTLAVTADITNSGRRSGAEVAELYIEPLLPRIDRPVRELKGFERLDLLPGQTKTATFVLEPRDFAYFDVPGKQWRADRGEYEIEIGASSRDIRLHTAENLRTTWTQLVPGSGAMSPYVTPTSLSTGKLGYSSSINQGNQAQFAFDADPDTRWESQASDPQWLSVDLGTSMTISRVVINWEAAYAASYQIQVSSDSNNWTTVYGTDNGQGGTETIKFPQVSARYVRMYGIKRATTFGYSIYSFDVFGS